MSEQSLVHFIGVGADQYWSALRVWGTPDYIHGRATWSCMGEIAPQDTVVLGRGAFTMPAKRRKAAHLLQATGNNQTFNTQETFK